MLASIGPGLIRYAQASGLVGRVSHVPSYLGSSMPSIIIACATGQLTPGATAEAMSSNVLLLDLPLIFFRQGKPLGAGVLQNAFRSWLRKFAGQLGCFPERRG